MTVIAELDEIISILEAQIPANPRSPKNQELRRRLERSLKKYFDDLEDAFPFSKLDALYNRYVKESITSDSDKIINPIIKTLDETLKVMLDGHLTTIYLTGSAETISWGKTKGGVPITFEGPPASEAIKWAEKHGATLVTQMNEETKRRLAHTISQAIENKRGIPGLSRDIRKTFGDMSRHRSNLIARTETANALSQASLDRMDDMGIEGKEWVTMGDDLVSDECEANENQGVIPVNQAFVSGAMAPPQHPDCRCALAPARLKR